MLFQGWKHHNFIIKMTYIVYLLSCFSNVVTCLYIRFILLLRTCVIAKWINFNGIVTGFLVSFYSRSRRGAFHSSNSSFTSSASSCDGKFSCLIFPTSIEPWMTFVFNKHLYQTLSISVEKNTLLYHMTYSTNLYRYMYIKLNVYDTIINRFFFQIFILVSENSD